MSGFQVVENDDTVDHAAETAAIVREAIMRFPTSGDLSEEGLQAMSTVDQFFDVWFMDRNAAKRPAFLRAVATPEVLERLFWYLRPGEDQSAPRPAHLLRVSLAVLNRLFKDAGVSQLVIETKLELVLSSIADTAGVSAHPNNRLMCIESVATLTKHAKHTETLEKALESSGFLARVQECIVPPAVVLERLKAEGGQGEDGDVAVYAEICTMVSSQLVWNYCVAEGASADFSNKHGEVLLSLLASLLCGTEKWSQKQVLHSHLDNLCKLMSKLPEAWPVVLGEDKGEKLVSVLRTGCGHGWTSAAKILKLLKKDEESGLSCGNCGKREEKLQVCGACHGISYCGRKCQSEHFKIHKGECMK